MKSVCLSVIVDTACVTGGQQTLSQSVSIEVGMRLVIELSYQFVYFGGLMLALFGTSLPVAHVAPASTGSITPIQD